MKILVVVIVGIAILAVGEAADCEKQTFDKCMDSFAKDVGLPGMPQDIQQLLDKLEALMNQGAAGLQQICKAVTNAKTCLGDQFDSCISVDYLKKIGREEQEAMMIVLSVYDAIYACTTAVDVFNKNMDCIKDVTKKSGTTIKKCADDYEEGATCKSSQIFLDCVTGPFKTGCPPVVAETMCETFKPGYVKLDPSCSIICSSTPTTPGTKPSGGTAPITNSFFGGIISLVLCTLYCIAF